MTGISTHHLTDILMQFSVYLGRFPLSTQPGRMTPGSILTLVLARPSPARSVAITSGTREEGDWESIRLSQVSNAPVEMLHHRNVKPAQHVQSRAPPSEIRRRDRARLTTVRSATVAAIAGKTARQKVGILPSGIAR